MAGRVREEISLKAGGVTESMRHIEES